jgi:ribosomal protein S18 acetylase RimI-like enzyme
VTVEVVGCGGEAAEQILELTRRCYAAYAALDPPSGALTEGFETVQAELEQGGGVLARRAEQLVGCLRMQRTDDRIHIRRVAVDPEHRGQGIARAMIDWCAQEATRTGAARITLGVRDQLPANRRVWEKLGFNVVAQHSFPPPSDWGWTEMERPVEG